MVIKIRIKKKARDNNKKKFITNNSNFKHSSESIGNNIDKYEEIDNNLTQGEISLTSSSEDIEEEKEDIITYVHDIINKPKLKKGSNIGTLQAIVQDIEHNENNGRREKNYDQNFMILKSLNDVLTADSTEEYDELEEYEVDPEILAAQDREVEEFRKRLESNNINNNRPKISLPSTISLDLRNGIQKDAYVLQGNG